MNPFAFAAIAARVNAAMLLSAMGKSEEANEQYEKLLDFMATLVRR